MARPTHHPTLFSVPGPAKNTLPGEAPAAARIKCGEERKKWMSRALALLLPLPMAVRSASTSTARAVVCGRSAPSHRTSAATETSGCGSGGLSAAAAEDDDDDEAAEDIGENICAIFLESALSRVPLSPSAE